MEEEQIFFKRFPAGKQDQVRGLVEYATLMGLTGKDLVSIGGKLDRIKAARERKRNIEIIDSFECLPIGADKQGRRQESNLDKRFKLKTANGDFNFAGRYGKWEVTSLATKVSKSINVSIYSYELGSINWERRQRYELLLAIADGTVQLNF